MKVQKRYLALLIVVLMFVQSMTGTFAAEGTVYTYGAEAQALHDLGLYDGVSNGIFVPDLGTMLTRETGVVMLLKLFGREADALAMTDADTILSKFTDSSDIADWAKKQVAYSVENGLVKGTTDTTIAPTANLNGKAYATLILRQLGYTVDADEYDTAPAILSEKGGLTADEATKFIDKNLIKDDLVGISFGSLKAKDAGGTIVIDSLIKDGVVDKTAAVAAGLLPEEPTPAPTQTPLPTPNPAPAPAPTPAPSEHEEHHEHNLRSGTAITSFSFVGIANQNTVINSSDYDATVTIPQGTSKNNLVAVFSLSDGATANINGIQQTSGVTANNFSQIVSYTVVAENGSSTNWTITVETYPSIGIVTGPTTDGSNQTWQLTIFSDAPSDGNVMVTVYQAEVYDKTYTIPVIADFPKEIIVSDVFAAAFVNPPIDTGVTLDENNDAVLFTKHGGDPLVITITGP